MTSARWARGRTGRSFLAGMKRAQLSGNLRPAPAERPKRKRRRLSPPPSRVGAAFAQVFGTVTVACCVVTLPVSSVAE